MHIEHLLCARPCAGTVRSSEGGVSIPILQMRKLRQYHGRTASGELRWGPGCLILTLKPSDTSQVGPRPQMDVGSFSEITVHHHPCPSERKPPNRTGSPDSRGLMLGAWRLCWLKSGNVGSAEPPCFWLAFGHMLPLAFHSELVAVGSSGAGQLADSGLVNLLCFVTSGGDLRSVPHP